IWVIHFVVNGNNKWVMWSPDNQSYTLNGLSSNYLQITEVVPNQLLNGGDSAVFVKNINSVNGNSYVFSQLTSFPILVEETNATGVENEIIDNFSFVIYPNPAQNIVSLQFSSSLNNAEINIHTAIGVEILILQNISGHKIEISTYKFEKGTYFISIKNENKNTTGKFIVD
ncbi:MAG: T9SS type A sorting domain-containing protein, partial [Bacteroidetes bacterium]|nr:T9SS type A sorting domain-containing protein [Bacteroidota bacterium]